MALRWRKHFIAGEAFEAASAVDVDGDGQLDIVSGGFWYRGPSFQMRYPIRAVQREGEYYDDFSAIPVSAADGRLEGIVTGGYWGKELVFLANRGEEPWAAQRIAEMPSIETTRAWDVDGDGVDEIVPNCPSGNLVVFRRTPGETVAFEPVEIWQGRQGHGLGFGDISGSGRGDFVMHHGWLEAPEDRWTGEWVYHPEFDLGSTASVPIIVADVNGDGLADLIVGNAHGYGLDWWEQGRDASGARTWTKHAIDPFNAQFHDLMWVDIDGDGVPELVTGKRWRAHSNNADPGSTDDVGIYYFKWTGDSFAKQVISHGAPGTAVGLGITFDVADLTGDGSLDVIAPGKDGLHVLYNLGEPQQ